VTLRTQSRNPNVLPASIELDARTKSNIAASVSIANDDQGYW